MADKLAFAEDLVTIQGRPVSQTTWHAAAGTGRPGEGTARCGKRVTVTDEPYEHRQSMARMHWCGMCKSRG